LYPAKTGKIMRIQNRSLVYLFGCLVILSLPAHATVQFVSITPSVTSPQPVGTSISWTVTATDTNSGPLTFQFNVAAPQSPFTLARDFNVGTLSDGTWTAPPFVWTPTGLGGAYQIQVIAKDFLSGESASQVITYQITALVTGSSPVVVPTAHPLVALFSAPSCPAGSTMHVVFQQQSKKTPAQVTNWQNCHPPAALTFEIAGMYPGATYFMFAQTNTGGTLTNGTSVTFTAGPLPTGVPIPRYQVSLTPQTGADTTDTIILHNLLSFTHGTYFPGWATDLSGKVVWYYYSPGGHSNTLTRPLPGGTMLFIADGAAWNPNATTQQYLRQIDLAGNIVRETNTGAIEQQLVALGATDGRPCSVIPRPAPVGAACLGGFHHDAIQTLPNGALAIIASVEKIFPPGTQGDTSGLPVDIIGDMIIVLDSNWRATWYFDTFQHDSGAPQLDINRPAVLGATCVSGQSGCPPILLLSPGIAPTAKDWLHANSLYYWPPDGDIIWSSRHQDWVMKVDYANGTGTGNILWRMGHDGDFTFNNINNDPWPWFSGQHDVGIENNGAGPLTLFDNANTRASAPPLGLGSSDSRGMALTFDENSMQVTPVLSQDLGVFSTAMASAQLLPNGTYFFQPAIVFVNLSYVNSNCIQILPTPGTVNGSQVYNIEGPESYRAWQMPSLYAPPTT
jgi:arylsulfate sulfotransferase